MQPRGRASDLNSSIFQVFFGEKLSAKGTRRYLDLGQSFQFYALLLLILLGHMRACADPVVFTNVRKLRILRGIAR